MRVHPEAQTRAEAVEFLRVDEAAERLRVCRRTILRAIQRGTLPYVQIGRQKRIPASALAPQPGVPIDNSSTNMEGDDYPRGELERQVSAGATDLAKTKHAEPSAMQ